MNTKRDKIKNLRKLVEGVKKIPLKSNRSGDDSRLDESSFNINQNDASNIHSEFNENLKADLDSSRMETRTYHENILQEVKEPSPKQKEETPQSKKERSERKINKLPLTLPKPKKKKMPVVPVRPIIADKKEVVDDRKDDTEDKSVKDKSVEFDKEDKMVDLKKKDLKAEEEEKSGIEKDLPVPPLKRPPPLINRLKPKKTVKEEVIKKNPEKKKEKKEKEIVKENFYVCDDKTVEEFLVLKNKLMDLESRLAKSRKEKETNHKEVKEEEEKSEELKNLEEKNESLNIQLDKANIDLEELTKEVERLKNTNTNDDYKEVIEKFRRNDEKVFEGRINNLISKQNEKIQLIQEETTREETERERVKEENESFLQRIDQQFENLVSKETERVDSLLDDIKEFELTLTDFGSYTIEEQITNLMLDPSDKTLSDVFDYIKNEISEESNTSTVEKHPQLNNLTSMKVNSVNVDNSQNFSKKVNRQISIINNLNNKGEVMKMESEDPSLNFASDSHFEINNEMKKEEGIVSSKLKDSELKVIKESSSQIKSETEELIVEEKENQLAETDTKEKDNLYDKKEKIEERKNDENIKNTEEDKKIEEKIVEEKIIEKSVEETENKEAVQSLIKPRINPAILRKKKSATKQIKPPIKKPFQPKINPPTLPMTEENKEPPKENPVVQKNETKTFKTKKNIRQNIIKNYNNNEYVNFFDDLSNSVNDDPLSSVMDSRRNSAVKNDARSEINENEYEDDSKSLKSLQYRNYRRNDKGVVNPFKKFETKKVNVFKKKSKPTSKITSDIPDLF